MNITPFDTDVLIRFRDAVRRSCGRGAEEQKGSTSKSLRGHQLLFSKINHRHGV